MKNTLKIEEPQVEEIVPPVVEEEPKAASSPKGNKVTKTLSSFMSGRFLTSDTTMRYLPFVLFIAFLGLCYIANGYYAQSKDRELDKLNGEIKELRSQYVIAKSKLMYISKESEVSRIASPMGIKESLIPPDKIVINDNHKVTQH
jgi:hypothetical protein